MTVGFTVKLTSGTELQIPGATQLLFAGDFICVDGEEGVHMAMIRASEVAYATRMEPEGPRPSHQRWAV